MEKRKLKLASLFDGSGGFPLGASMCGIEPVWASEIEPFPIRVTSKRFPNMKHYGDVSKINGAEVEPVDIITFGSPCQDLSTAGKRAGLEIDGGRSNLFYQAIRIIKEMRWKTNNEFPRYAVWENVLGAFSSNDGEDFRSVLQSFAQICSEAVSIPRCTEWEKQGLIMGDDFSIAWRVFDAQYWGVAQRRKRVYLVADFRGGSAKEVLFESEGLSRYSAESYFAWQRVTRGFGPCFEESESENGYRGDRGGLDGEFGEYSSRGDERGGITSNVVSIENHPNDSRVKICEDGKVQSLTSRMGTGGGNVPLVMKNTIVNIPYGISAKDPNAMKSSNPHSGVYEASTSRTLDLNGGNPACNQGGIAIVSIEGNGARPSHLGSGFSEKDVSFTLNATEIHGVAYGIDKTCFTAGYNSGFWQQPEEEIASTLLTTPNGVSQPDAEGTNYIVRRLTPQECARLQGFPDWWCYELETPNPSADDVEYWKDIFNTQSIVFGNGESKKTNEQIIKWLQNPNKDCDEYKMWGNGVALPCVFFVMAGIEHFYFDEEAKDTKYLGFSLKTSLW